jgi:hypothetical protein
VLSRLTVANKANAATEGRSAEEKDSIADSIHTALVSTLEVPEANRYQLFNEYDGESFRHTSGYLGMTYTDQLLIIEITILEGDDDEGQEVVARRDQPQSGRVRGGG